MALGPNAYFNVNAAGNVELIVNGQRYRLGTLHWKYPTSLTDNISPDGQNANSPKVAMDNKGNAIITWSQSDGSHTQTFKSEYRNGIWTNPSSLSDNISLDGQDIYGTRVAMDNNGNAIIAWYQSDGANTQVFKSEYRGGAWTNPINLIDNISPNGQNVYDVGVAMDNNGNAIITWRQYDGSYYRIFKSEYRGGVWTNPVLLTDNISPGGTTAYDPQVAMDDNGNAIITWRQSDGANYQIFMSEYRNGVWTNPTSLTDNISPDGQSAFGPQVAMDNNGNAIITWYQSNGTNEHIYKSEYRGGVWHHPTDLTDSISQDVWSANASFPQVAMDDNGNAIITWQQDDNVPKTQIFKSEYRGGVWHNPLNPSDNISPNGQNASSPQVAMDNNGNAIITWYQSDGSYNQIFKSEYRGGVWYNPSNLTDNISPDGQNAYNPQVVMDNNGNAIIVWYQSDGSKAQIFMAEYRWGF